jgi:hypothetical protein
MKRHHSGTARDDVHVIVVSTSPRSKHLSFAHVTPAAVTVLCGTAVSVGVAGYPAQPVMGYVPSVG